MTFRIAANDELDPYFATNWFNDVLRSTEIDEAWSSLSLSLSLLAGCTDGFEASLASRAIYADAKVQMGFTNRIGKFIHDRGGCRNLDSTAPPRWLPWKFFEDYIKSDVCLATQCDNVFLRQWSWLYEGNPVGHTAKLLREDCMKVEWETHGTFPSSWPRLSSSGARAGVGSRA